MKDISKLLIIQQRFELPNSMKSKTRYRNMYNEKNVSINKKYKESRRIYLKRDATYSQEQLTKNLKLQKE